MKKNLATGIGVFVLVGFLTTFSFPAPARAMEQCPDMAPTIQSLQTCLQHATVMQVIDNAGITNSLQKKLEVAQAAQENSKPGEAIKVLQAFINEVEAQSGKHIASEQAGHIIMHAKQVIQALEA